MGMLLYTPCVGFDWLKRDWVADSKEIESGGESEQPRLAAIEALKNSTSAIELGLRRKLQNKSANVHWSPSRGKMWSARSSVGIAEPSW